MSNESPIAVDDDPAVLDSDSALGDDLSTFTQSLTSSVINYPYENGRRYHAYREGAYYFPNDEKENERLDLTHHMFTMVLGDKLHLAPIGSNPQNILDIGTGTGLWCIEMGDDYPSAQILGNDLSAVQPSMVPPNVKFEIDDVESAWTYSKFFDYIHCRYMMLSISDWPKLVKNCFDFLSPGGWVEFQDWDLRWYSEDGSLKPDSALAKWVDLLVEASKKMGRDHLPGGKLEGWVRDAGFTEVHHQKFRIPVGRWPKDERLV
jgi:SAM-dependent methyltransferase